MSVVICTDLSGKELRTQIDVDNMVTSGNLSHVMVSTLAQNARNNRSILTLCKIFTIFFSLRIHYLPSRVLLIKRTGVVVIEVVSVCYCCYRIPDIRIWSLSRLGIKKITVHWLFCALRGPFTQGRDRWVSIERTKIGLISQQSLKSN